LISTWLRSLTGAATCPYRKPKTADVTLRIDVELLKPVIDVGQTTVAKYMPKRRRPDASWKAFPGNHVGIASIDCALRAMIIRVSGAS
jgi:hypothetical protein